MVSEAEIERRKRIERHLQNKIDYLKSTTDGYKGAIDKCDAAELSSYSWIIATQTIDLKEAVKQYIINIMEKYMVINNTDSNHNTNHQRNGEIICTKETDVLNYTIQQRKVHMKIL